MASTASYLDGLDFLELARRLKAGGGAGPVDARRMRGASRLVAHAPWPEDLHAEADRLVPVLQGLAEALAGRDLERAATLASAAHVMQLELVRSCDRWLDANDPWSPVPAARGHHHPGQPHADHSPHHGGQLGMAGDLHLEVRAADDGLRVWLSDAWRAPVDAAGVTGRIVLFPDSENEQTLPLQVAGPDLLVAPAEVPDVTALHVSVRLEGTPEGDVEMDFVLPRDSGSPSSPSRGEGPATRPATQPATQPSPAREPSEQ